MVLLAEKAPLVELVLDEVRLLQQIFELVEALAGRLVHVLQEHFVDSLIWSWIRQQVGEEEGPCLSGSRFRSLAKIPLVLLAAA